MKDLSSHGVPSNAICEIMVTNLNDDTAEPVYGGVRARGSSLQRALPMHEAEGGGVDAVTVHVQANVDSEIECFAGSIYNGASDVKFYLIGWWNSGSYVEAADSFYAGATDTWVDKDLNDGTGTAFGVPSNKVVEIILANQDGANYWVAGVRQNGSTIERKVKLCEAETAGYELATMLVQCDENSVIEALAGDNSSILFVHAGYFNTTPCGFTENWTNCGDASTCGDDTWCGKTLSGLPGGAWAEMILANQDANFEGNIGVREVGSSLSRNITLHEAEPPNSGWDMVRMHVQLNASSVIEVMHGDVSDDHNFYLAGYWQ